MTITTFKHVDNNEIYISPLEITQEWYIYIDKQHQHNVTSSTQNLWIFNFSQERVHMSENAINNAREGYRSVAKRGAVCFDVARCLTEINLIYQTSWQQFLEVYDSSIKHSER